MAAHGQSPSTGTALLCWVFVSDPCGVTCSITSILQTLLSVLANSNVNSWSSPRHYWKFTWSFGSSIVWLCLMSSPRTVPSCPQKLARTAQDTISVPGASHPCDLCINTGWFLQEEVSSVFCRQCSVWSCEGGCDWDLSLSFLANSLCYFGRPHLHCELKVICSLFPVETCAGWTRGICYYLWWVDVVRRPASLPCHLGGVCMLSLLYNLKRVLPSIKGSSWPHGRKVWG